MLNEVELMEELPYYRTLQKPPQHHHPQPPLPIAPHYPTAPRGGLRHPAPADLRPCYDDETSIAIIAPDIRMPQHHHHHTGSPLETSRYAPLGCPDALASAVALASDVGTDALACYVLFAEGRVLWAALAAAFVLLASVSVSVSLRQQSDNI